MGALVLFREHSTAGVSAGEARRFWGPGTASSACIDDAPKGFDDAPVTDTGRIGVNGSVYTGGTAPGTCGDTRCDAGTVKYAYQCAGCGIQSVT